MICLHTRAAYKLSCTRRRKYRENERRKEKKRRETNEREEEEGVNITNEVWEEVRGRSNSENASPSLSPSLSAPPSGGNSSFRLGSGHLCGGPRRSGT